MTDQKSKKCVNTTCRKFNTEWTNNCSTFVVMNDCPDFVPEELEPEKLDKCLNLNCIYYDEKRSSNCFNEINMQRCRAFRPEQLGKSVDDIEAEKAEKMDVTPKDWSWIHREHVQFGMPQECPLCGKNNPSGYKLPQDCMFCNDQDGTFKVPEPDNFSDLRWCKMCGYRYAENYSDYCGVCEQEMMDDIEDDPKDNVEGYICEVCGKQPLSDTDGEWMGDGGFYCWDCVGKDEQESNTKPGKSFAPKNHEQEGKTKMRLIPLDLLQEFLIPAYEEGLVKYFEESWRLGFNISTMMDGLQRHIEKFYYEGEDLDQETLEKYGIEKTHLGAALFCILCMCQTVKNYPELDDRVGKKEWIKNKSRSIPGEPCNCPTATINGRDGEECEFFDMDNETCLYGKEEDSEFELCESDKQKYVHRFVEITSFGDNYRTYRCTKCKYEYTTSWEKQNEEN